MPTPVKLRWCAPLAGALLAFLIACLIGPQGSLSPAQTATLLAHWASGTPLPETACEILVNVRLPRVCEGFLVGAALSAAGAALQAIARNPLVAPDIVGIAPGAAFGAALALCVPFLPLHGTAFACGLFAAMMTYTLARTRHGLSTVALVLAGVVVGSVFTALLALLQAFSDPMRLQSIVSWTLGNLHHANWHNVVSLLPPLLLSGGVLWLLRWRLNVLALGDDEARTAGLDPLRQKLWVLLATVLAASACVAVAGIIALIGLVVPHVARRMGGADNRRLLPLSALLGGGALILVDALARAVSAVELPVGIFTTLVAGPVLLGFLRHGGLRQRED